MITTQHGDSRELIRAMASDSVAAVVTDPPYNLKFMGQAWDTGETAFDPAFWADVLRIMRPGAHLVAFGGTRTYHRLVCAIEDAGFEIRDQLGWVFGSGFPKSHDVSKGIDRALGKERSTVRTPMGPTGNKYCKGLGDDRPWMKAAAERGYHEAASDEAALWGGWGTALKPSFEPVCLAQKPYTDSQQVDIIGSTIQNLEHRLWSLLPVSAAAKIFELSQSEFDAVCASAQWSVAEKSNTRDALCARMDTSQFVLATISSLNTVSLWKRCFAENSARASTSTTGTESSTTIDLKTWKSCLSMITPESIILAHKAGHWSSADASSAERYLSAAASKWSATRELSAAENALSAAPIFSPDEIGPIKPGWADICLARKPLSEKTVAANVLKWGCGALNIDGCRIAGANPSIHRREVARRTGTTPGRPGEYGDGHAYVDRRSPQRYTADHPGEALGRWPANIAHDGSDEVLAAFPEAPGQQADVSLNAPSAKTSLVYGPMRREGEASQARRYTEEGGTNFAMKPGARRGDSGSAARFFYCAKASRSERNGSQHPTVKPIALMRWLCRLVTPPGALVLDPFAGSGTTGIACEQEGFDSILMERDDAHFADMRRRIDATRATTAPDPEVVIRDLFA